ncbi:hypothetical protein BGZ98_003825, partial [Dissophora globulifera]
SLAYLLSRPSTSGADVATDNQTWTEVQAARGVTSDTLLTIRNEKSVRKKASFNRLHNIFGRSKDSSPAGSPRSVHTAVATNVSTGAHHQQSLGAPLSAGSADGLGAGSAGSIVNSVVEYPSHMAGADVHSSSGAGFATVNGGRIMSQSTMNGGPIMSQASSSLGTNTSPKSRMTEVQEGHEEDGYRREYEDEAMEDEDLDEDDGELPEHVRRCCDGKHDIGALHHH